MLDFTSDTAGDRPSPRTADAALVDDRALLDAYSNAVIDVTDRVATAVALAALLEKGAIQILVNNAGTVALGQIGQFDMAKWQKVIDVNLTGTFIGMVKAVDPMKAAGGGSIINVSSVNGSKGAFGQTNYASAKAAILRDIPCITTVQGLAAAVQGIKAAVAGEVGVRSLQSWNAAMADELDPR